MAPNSERKKPAGRGFPRRNRGGQSRRNYLLGNNSKPTLDSDGAVPLLKFGAQNNWLNFKEKMLTACTEKYGYLGRLINTEEYYEFPEIDMTPYQGWETDELKKTLYIDEAKDKARMERAMVQDQPKMYAYILSKMSKESMDELKQSGNRHWNQMIESIINPGICFTGCVPQEKEYMKHIKPSRHTKERAVTTNLDYNHHK